MPQGDRSLAQLTLGAIAAQVSRVQLCLKAGGCMLRSPLLCQDVGAFAFINWLTIFEMDDHNKSQVRHILKFIEASPSSSLIRKPLALHQHS